MAGVHPWGDESSRLRCGRSEGLGQEGLGCVGLVLREEREQEEGEWSEREAGHWGESHTQTSLLSNEFRKTWP